MRTNRPGRVAGQEFEKSYGAYLHFIGEASENKAQKRFVLDYAHSASAKVEVFTEIFDPQTRKRGEDWHKLDEWLCANQLSGLCCWDLGYLKLSLREILKFVTVLKQKHLPFYGVRQRLDFTSANGDFYIRGLFGAEDVQALKVKLRTAGAKFSKRENSLKFSHATNADQKTFGFMEMEAPPGNPDDEESSE